MSDKKTEENIKAMREQLAAVINKVPPSINSASIQVVREFKSTVVKARKAIEQPRASFEKLHSLFNQLNQFHRP